MGESDDSKDNSAPETAKPEIISPASAEKAARTRKDPPVLEGEAEVLSEKAAGKPRTDSSTTHSASPSSSPAPAQRSAASLALVGVLAGIAGALAVGAAGHMLGYGRVSLETQDQAIKTLETRLAALDSQSGANLVGLQERTLLLAKRLEAAEAILTEQSQSPENIAAMRAQLDALAQSVETFSASLADASKGYVETQARLVNLETTLTALNTALSALSPRLDDTVTRVNNLEDKAKDPDAAGRAALGLALAGLTRASQGPGPFKAELDAIASFLPDEPELAKLAPVAAKGVPTLSSLKAQFPKMAQSVFDAERQAGATSLWAKFWGNAKSLVTVRRTGEISGTSTEAIIARIEARLEVDDLAAAAKEARGLQGAAAKAAKPWLAKAQARLNIDSLVRALSTRVAARLAKG
jgi:hypothetical protein